MKFSLANILSGFGSQQQKPSTPSGTEKFLQSAITLGQPDREPWAYLKATYPSVYNAFQTVQTNRPELNADVITWGDSRRFMYILSLTDDYMSDRSGAVVCELDNGRFCGGPRSMIDICSPEDAVRSILKQAEFRGHIAVVEKGKGLDGEPLKMIVPGEYPTRSKIKISMEETSNLIAG